MSSAYVMISCDSGQEKRIIDEVRSMGPVRHVEETLGAYEIVARLESPSADAIKDTVKNRISRMSSVRSALTLFVN